MTADRTEALVLRLTAWSETSLIGSLYTRHYGKISVVAKGARRPKSPFEAALDLLSQCHVVFLSKPNDALHLLTEAKLIRRFRLPGRQLIRLYCGYYIVELLERFTEAEVPQPELFELAQESLNQLQNLQSEVRAIVLRFELQLMRLLGHLPSFTLCVQCGNSPQQASSVVYSPVSGGILCDHCLAGGRQLLRLPIACRDYLQSFTSEGWRQMSIDSYTNQSRAALRAVVVRTLTCMLDQKLKLHPYLEELGR